MLERFNRTIQEEFVNQGNFDLDTERFNKAMTEWLIKHNFKRPHQALGYIAPINFQVKHLKVLPMCPSSKDLTNVPTNAIIKVVRWE